MYNIVVWLVCRPAVFPASVADLVIVFWSEMAMAGRRALGVDGVDRVGSEGGRRSAVVVNTVGGIGVGVKGWRS